MPERINKLQPNRLLHLRGFDSLGAAAALHSATANSFEVSGVFRDPADFAVLILHDMDNFYEHPRLKHLPDSDFDGLTLTFDVRYEGLMTLDSPKFETIAWPYLSMILDDAASRPLQIRLNEPTRFTQVGGTQTAASAAFIIENNDLKQFDRLTLWYLNLNFDYLVDREVECLYGFFGAATGTVHRITVAGVDYTHTQTASDTNTSIALALVAALAGHPSVWVTQDTGASNQVLIRAKLDDNAPVSISSTAGASHTLYGIGAATVAADLAAQINAVNWTNVLMPLTASATGPTLTITSQRTGVDGNMLKLYAVPKNTRLQTTQAEIALSGAVSDAIWRVTFDFAAVLAAIAPPSGQSAYLPKIRQMWLTYAPALANGARLESTEWRAIYTNWTLTGPDAKQRLLVAGPDSVRIEHNDVWCTYSGTWIDELGFYSNGYARGASAIGAKVTVRYACASTHDLYVGTSLYSDRAAVTVRLDGDAATTLDCRLTNLTAVNTRRRVRTNVPAGEHTVTFEVATTGVFYFDFLEAVVPSDVPDPPPARTNLSPALDYSTDHTFKLSPARLMWIFDRLGFAGPMNEYIGVFWWNQRKRVGVTLPQVTVTFAGTFVSGDSLFLNIGGLSIGKSIFPNESNALFARHFAHTINATFVGVWAEAIGDTLVIESRSPTAAYAFSFSASTVLVSGSTGTLTYTGALDNGVAGEWQVDPTQSPALNRGAQDWHRDLYAECQARARPIVTACSMELVNPPLDLVARFPGGEPVITSVGFGSLSSAHCAFISPMLDYQKSVYLGIANLMAAAGLTPRLQLGEFVWWFFSNGTGMAYYDDETKALALTVLGRPLHTFTQPTDDPTVNSSADAIFLRNRLRDYAAAIIAHVHATHPTAQFELLFPYDVNHPNPVGVFNLGGALNRFVNLPAEWETKPGSGFDTLKMEALDFGAWSRNLDLAKTAIRLPMELGWPKDSVRYLVPVFRPYSAWEQEYLLAVGEGVPYINLWAFDHVNLYNLRIEAPNQPGRVQASD